MKRNCVRVPKCSVSSVHWKSVSMLIHFYSHATLINTANKLIYLDYIERPVRIISHSFQDIVAPNSSQIFVTRMPSLKQSERSINQSDKPSPTHNLLFFYLVITTVIINKCVYVGLYVGKQYFRCCNLTNYV